MSYCQILPLVIFCKAYRHATPFILLLYLAKLDLYLQGETIGIYYEHTLSLCIYIAAKIQVQKLRIVLHPCHDQRRTYIVGRQ
jgi:hypothetical protein